MTFARECEHCGGPIPDSRDVRALYCSRDCNNRSTRALVTAARREARAGRICPECGTAISDDRKAGTIYCGISCQDRAGWRRRHPRPEPAPKRVTTCEHCGETFTGRPGARFCGKPCATAARWQAGQMTLPRRVRKAGG